ncbi:MAG: PAS domain-containing protein, partial [Termitinemataceae bacterium]
EQFARALNDFRNILIHYTRKENQLFPYLEAVGFDAPSKVMWGKHDEIRALFREIEEALQQHDVSSAVRKARALAGKAEKMFFMEEHILFPTALRKLDERTWVAIRRGEAAIGYAWIQPGNVWDPDIAAYKEQASATTETIPQPDHMPGSIHLGEGWLTAEQIDLMLKNLPIDVSFVDENDRVLYYSDTAERIFPRSPGVIGRNVANCHPPKSVHIVKRILEAFRNKEKQVAEFWIELGGKFIHIRYFPVYDAQGNYKGTLEVSQDVTSIRTLEGQRRLLDWD